MKQATWHIGSFAITSYGNGLAYAVVNETDGREFFLQGDDASTWRDQYDAADESSDETTLPAFLHQSMSDYVTA
ncbi:hypothetical protein SAMN05428983_0866 [Agrobacterium fabrum]|uniref:Uncharacterized protein n=1 Tax=Agrobacterium fabrum TaxID=1176649 RepID=A0A7Z7BHJ8_9HYPH|nr:hypothetical protein [Agrobacterium fabrum]SDJ25987.1 hypothetical protein SAMN05428983_0866 [Agrobacterium fabrum]